MTKTKKATSKMSEARQHLPLAGARRKAREFALLGVYQSLIDATADFASIDANLLTVMSEEDGQPVAGCELSAEDFAKCDQAFYREILEGVMQEKDALTEVIAKYTDREPSRLSTVELSCILIGTWELKHCLETPYRVVVNEAVELTKSFGADRGYRLVNGLLDKVAHEVRAAEIAKK